MKKDRPFWLVWNIDGGAPTYKHDSYESAENEAKRLARACKGQSFCVLESVAAFSVEDVQQVDLRPEYIPF